MCTIRTVPSPHPVHNVTTVYSFTRILGTIFGFHARERAYLEMILGISTKVYSTQQKPEIIPFNRSLLCPCARDGNFVVWPFAPAINSDRAPLGSNGHWSRPVESSIKFLVSRVSLLLERKKHSHPVDLSVVCCVCTVSVAVIFSEEAERGVCLSVWSPGARVSAPLVGDSLPSR
jgi:hypothetical protein